MRDEESQFATHSYSRESSSMVSGQESIPSKYGIERNLCFQRRGKKRQGFDLEVVGSSL